MKKTLIHLGILTSLTLGSAMVIAASKNKPDAKTPPIDSTSVPSATASSAIPERRDFPLSTQINPCDDFHGYVCQIAESNFKLRDDRSKHTFAFSDSDERLLEAKKAFMKNLANEKKLSARGQQFKDFYMGCMDTKGRASEETKKIAQIQKNLEKIKTAKEFVSFLINQRFDGSYGIISFGNNPSLDNSKKLDAILMANIMMLPDQSYYEKPEVMEDYKNLLVKFFTTVEPKITAEEANRRADAQVQLQKDFAKIYPVAAVRRQRFSEKRDMTQKDANAKYANLQVKRFLDKAPKSTRVSIPIPESLDFLKENLTDANLNLFKDFYLYRVGSDLMDEAYPDFFNAQFAFKHKHFGGPEKRSDLQERCTSVVDDYFTMELDQTLIERLFPNFKDEKVQALAGQIRESILAGLERNTWLSPEAKKEAIRKTKTARLQLVRPRTDREWDFMPVQKYSKKMFIGNGEIYNRARLQKTIVELRHPANQDAWGMGPLVVNAYYSPSENKFVLPIGILQYPFYDKDGTLLENLGAVGAVMGHELGHGIDDQGSKYNADGKLQQWMTMNDLAEFNKRGQKMLDQFNKIGHNGPLTQGENIADLVGLSFAYHAAFPDGKGSIEDKQKFFVSYGRVWCTVVRPQFAEMLLKRDPHAAGYARINEQVKHQPGFAEAFQCKANSKMNLPDSERIQIW